MAGGGHASRLSGRMSRAWKVFLDAHRNFDDLLDSMGNLQVCMNLIDHLAKASLFWY